MSDTWREHAARIIAKAVAARPDLRGKELDAYLYDFYPYGERAHFPYKVWREEVNRVCAGSPHPEKVKEQDAGAELFKRGAGDIVGHGE